MKDNFKYMQLEMLSEKLEGWDAVKLKASTQKGWLRAIRKAICMPGEYLAKKMGITVQRALAIEKGEAAGTVTLNTLMKAADALDCDLVYAVVPRSGTLKDNVMIRARKKARAILEPVDHAMRLEDQGVDDIEARINTLALELAQKPNFELWRDS